MQNKIKQIIKKYPNFFIYYYDNGSWCIYAQKEDSELNDEGNESKPPVLEGDDFGIEGTGYAPPLVVAMAELLGGEVDSV